MKRNLVLALTLLLLVSGCILSSTDPEPDPSPLEPADNILGPHNPYHGQIIIEADSVLNERTGPENLIDGDLNTRWVTAHLNTGPQEGEPYLTWVTIKLPHPEKVHALVFYTGVAESGAGDPNMIVRSFALDYRDGDTWREACSVELNSERRCEVRFKAVEAQEWRLRITDPGRYDWSVRAFELELYRQK
ncbi:MAG TPA: discoidin domain-containing protein [Firmicutes bacterium]|nr:discoidin domain-containing protein [Bacillota bacterium]